jgi:hypothetical protein
MAAPRSAVATGSSGILSGTPQPAAAQPAAARGGVPLAMPPTPALPPTPSDAWAMSALPPTNPSAPLTPAPLGPPSLDPTMPVLIEPVLADVAAESPGGGTAPELPLPLTSRPSRRRSDALDFLTTPAVRITLHIVFALAGLGCGYLLLRWLRPDLHLP